MLLGAKAGDIVWYFKTNKGVSTDPKEIAVKEYKEMLMATVKNALEILGHGSGETTESDIFGITKEIKEE